MKNIRILKKPDISKLSQSILAAGLPVVSLALIGGAVWLTTLDSYDLARLTPYIHSIYEHILMSLTLIVGGAMVADIAARDAENNKQD